MFMAAGRLGGGSGCGRLRPGRCAGSQAGCGSRAVNRRWISLQASGVSPLGVVPSSARWSSTKARRSSRPGRRPIGPGRAGAAARPGWHLRCARRSSSSSCAAGPPSPRTSPASGQAVPCDLRPPLHHQSTQLTVITVRSQRRSAILRWAGWGGTDTVSNRICLKQCSAVGWRAWSLAATSWRPACVP
jgi:hypothetical protein